MLQLLIKQQEHTSTTYICYSFWLNNRNRLILHTYVTASDCPFGKATGTDFYYTPMLQLLIAPLVSTDCPFGISWLPLWYLLIAPLVSLDCPLVSPDCPFGISWLPLWYFETFLILHAYVRASGWSFGIFWLPIWYLLIVPLVSTDCPFGIFLLPLWHLLIALWYLLIAPLVKQQEQTSTTHLCYSFWLPLWYLLIAPLVSTDCSFGISWLPFGISWLPLWYFETFLILHAYVRASGWSFGIFWLPIWYLLIVPLVSTDCPFDIF